MRKKTYIIADNDQRKDLFEIKAKTLEEAFDGFVKEHGLKGNYRMVGDTLIHPKDELGFFGTCNETIGAPACRQYSVRTKSYLIRDYLNDNRDLIMADSFKKAWRKYRRKQGLKGRFKLVEHKLSMDCLRPDNDNDFQIRVEFCAW